MPRMRPFGAVVWLFLFLFSEMRNCFDCEMKTF